MNVFEVVKENVTARQAAEAYGLKVGRTGMACCPFHSDKSPSMKLDERYYCFGCGATGDAVDLTAKLFGIGLREAAVKLAEDFGLMCHIFRQKPAVGTGISDQFLFIEVLRVVQGLLCRVAKHTVGFSL